METYYLKQILENKTEEEKKELFNDSQIIIDEFNNKFTEYELSSYGNEVIFNYVTLYGIREVARCMFLSFEKYSHLPESDLFDKFKGIVYNRNEKNYLRKK